MGKIRQKLPKKGAFLGLRPRFFPVQRTIFPFLEQDSQIKFFSLSSRTKFFPFFPFQQDSCIYARIQLEREKGKNFCLRKKGKKFHRRILIQKGKIVLQKGKNGKKLPKKGVFSGASPPIFSYLENDFSLFGSRFFNKIPTYTGIWRVDISFKRARSAREVPYMTNQALLNTITSSKLNSEVIQYDF